MFWTMLITILTGGIARLSKNIPTDRSVSDSNVTASDDDQGVHNFDKKRHKEHINDESSDKEDRYIEHTSKHVAPHFRRSGVPTLSLHSRTGVHAEADKYQHDLTAYGNTGQPNQPAPREHNKDSTIASSSGYPDRSSGDIGSKKFTPISVVGTACQSEARSLAELAVSTLHKKGELLHALGEIKVDARTGEVTDEGEVVASLKQSNPSGAVVEGSILKMPLDVQNTEKNENLSCHKSELATQQPRQNYKMPGSFE